MRDRSRFKRIYRFDFWKDRYWIWALAFPAGLLCWVIPFLAFIGAFNSGSAAVWFPFLVFIVLFIPCYPIGRVFVGPMMEYLLTEVTITNERIAVSYPWKVFPLIPLFRSIESRRIEKINSFAVNGTRTVIYLYYFEKSKEEHFDLPKFLHDPSYLKEISSINVPSDTHFTMEKYE